MANLRITEFPGLGGGSNETAQMAGTPATAEQVVAIGAGSTQSAPFNAATRIVRLHAEAICAVAVGGSNPTASGTNSARLIAGQTEYFAVKPGDKIAVIQST